MYPAYSRNWLSCPKVSVPASAGWRDPEHSDRAEHGIVASAVSRRESACARRRERLHHRVVEAARVQVLERTPEPNKR
jgi:hypothetical protein